MSKLLRSLPWALLGIGLAGSPVHADTVHIEQIEGGNAYVQFRGSSGYRFASEADVLGVGDALLPGPNTQVTVRCPNGNFSPLVPGRLSGIRVFCPDVQSIRRFRRKNDLLALNRGDFPYKVQVLAAQPTLRWPELPAAEGYRVRVFEPNSSAELATLRWESETDATAIAYAGPALRPEGDYVLVVESLSGESAAADSAVPCGEAEETETVNPWRSGECFRVSMSWLEAEAEAALTADIAAIEAESGDAAAQALALAYRYEAAGMHWQAIAELEQLMAQGEQPSAVHQLLGEAYLQAGWIESAQAAYESAHRLALAEGARWPQLEASLGLAKVAAWRMQPQAAAGYLWTALGEVSQVQDLGQADVIVQWLRRLD